MAWKNVKILTDVNIVGFILVMVAGWVDTVGVKLFLYERVSFMTGRAAQIGEWLARSEYKKLAIIAIIVIAFITGAGISTRVTRKWGLTGGLIFTGLLLFLSAFSVYTEHARFVSVAIPLAMGSQNATTSLTAINRTTHLTGPATDIGIKLSMGDWSGAIFWILRWIAFPLGAFMGYEFIEIAIEHKNLNTSLALIIPSIVIISTGILQKKVFDIPLLETIVAKEKEKNKNKNKINKNKNCPKT